MFTMIDLKRPTVLTAVLAACLGIASCGGTTNASNQSADTHSSATQATQASTISILSPTDATPSKIVAHVGRTPITLGAVEHLMVLASAPAPLPDPPSYSSCITRLREEPSNEVTSPTARTQAQLERTCRQSYQELLQAALRTAIHNQWLIGEAAEEGLSVDKRDIQHEFEVSKRSFGTDAKFEAYRKSTKETVAEMMFDLKLTQLTDKIFRSIRDKEKHIGNPEIARYYDSHRQQFVIPQGRTVRIVRTATRGAVLKVKRELQSGRSFASVAKDLSSIGQPIGAKHGEVADLKPGVFEEKDLNDAIFTARLNHLYGPFELTASHKTIAPETNSGFFMFEVTGVVPGGQQPLAQVRGAIAVELTKAQKGQTLAVFVTAYRHRWTARTDCQPGYVVKYCKQYKGKAEEAPTTL